MPISSCTPCCDPAGNSRLEMTFRESVLRILCSLLENLAYGGAETLPIQETFTGIIGEPESTTESVADGVPVNVPLTPPGFKSVTVTNGIVGDDPLDVVYTVSGLPGPFTANILGGASNTLTFPFDTPNYITSVLLTRDAGGATSDVDVAASFPGIVPFTAPGVKTVTITNGVAGDDDLDVTYTTDPVIPGLTATLVGGQTYVFALPNGSVNLVTSVTLDRVLGGATSGVIVMGYNPGSL